MAGVGVPREHLLRDGENMAYAVSVPGRGVDLTLRKAAVASEAGAPAEAWWDLCGFTLHVPDPLAVGHAGWTGAWPAGLPGQVHLVRLPELEAVFGPAELVAGMSVYFVLPAPGAHVGTGTGTGMQSAEAVEDVAGEAEDGPQWTVQCVLDRRTQTLRSLAVMAVGEPLAVSVLAPWSQPEQRTQPSRVQCASGDVVPRTGVWRLSLPATHPLAQHLHAHPQRFVHRRQGQAMHSGGLLPEKDEIFAIWTWLHDD